MDASSSSSKRSIARAVAGDGHVVVVEGPAGIGKSRLLAEARRPAAGSMRVLSGARQPARGRVRVRRGAPAVRDRATRRRSVLAGAAAPAAAVFGELGRRPEAARRSRRCTACTGSCSTSPSRGRCCSRSTTCTGATGRRCCSSPTSRGGSRASRSCCSPACARPSPAPTRRCSASSRTSRPSTNVRPGPLSEAAVAAFVEERLGRPAGGRLHRRLPRRHRRQPAAAQPAPDRARRRGRAPGRRARRPRQGHRPARGLAHRAAAARAPAARGERRRAGGRRAGRRRRAARGGRARRRRGGARSARPPARWRRPRSCAPSRPWSSCTRSCATPSTTTCRPAERELQHTRAADLLRDERRAHSSRSPRSCCTPRRAASAGRGAAVGRGARGDAGGRGRQRRRLPAACAGRASRSSGQLLFELGAAEVLTSGPAAAEHLALAYDELTDPRPAPRSAGLLGRALMFTGSRRPRRWSRRAAGELPDSLDDLRQALEALEFMTVYFGAGDAGAVAACACTAGRPATARAARMLAAMAAWEAVGSDGTAAECAALALAALDGGRLVAADPGADRVPRDRSRSSSPTGPRPSRSSARLLADAHRGGSLVSAGSTLLWHGYGELRRGDLLAAEESAAGGRERAPAAGATAGAARRSATACWPPSCTSAAASTTPRAARADRHRRPAPEHDGLVAGDPRRPLLTPRPGGRRPSPWRTPSASTARRCPTPRRLWWRSLKAEALDRLDRSEEALELREELEVTRAFGAPASLGRTLRVLGTLQRDEGLDTLREAVEVLEGSTARLEHAKALAALGSALRRARQPSEAREPLRRALELAAVCGADGLAAHVRSELHAAGSRPAPRCAQRRRVADAERAARRRPRGGRAQQPGDRPGALRHPEDGRGPPLQRLPQARDPLAPRADRALGAMSVP